MALLPRPPHRPLVMGIVNVTPDSFSDGGKWADATDAVEHGRTLFRQGADILDIGGESTRPGATRPSVEEEIRRVIPVIAALSQQGAVVSIDTMRAEVAQAAIAAGAHIINDVSGGKADPQMGVVAARSGAGFIAMHWRQHAHTMQNHTEYEDLVADINRELDESVQDLLDVGVDRHNLAVDPGFGFAKTPAQNWELLRRMDEFDVQQLPVLWGTSRKTFLGYCGTTAASTALQEPPGEQMPLPPEQRDAATAATSLLAALHGAWAVRVHDIPSTLAALDVHHSGMPADNRTPLIRFP